MASTIQPWERYLYSSNSEITQTLSDSLTLSKSAVQTRIKSIVSLNTATQRFSNNWASDSNLWTGRRSDTSWCSCCNLSIFYTARWFCTETSSQRTFSLIRRIIWSWLTLAWPRKPRSCRGGRATVLCHCGTEHLRSYLEAKITFLVLTSGQLAASLESSCKPNQSFIAKVTQKCWIELSECGAHRTTTERTTTSALTC